MKIAVPKTCATCENKAILTYERFKYFGDEMSFLCDECFWEIICHVKNERDKELKRIGGECIDLILGRYKK